MSKVRINILVLSAYFGLTVVMLWPVALHFATGIPGSGGDGWQNYWNLWWVKQALLVEGTNPYHTGYLYPPDGASLLFHTLNILNGLWTLPLQLNGNVALAYNSVVFFSFTLTGYGGYLLALHTLTRLGLKRHIRLAAFVAGVIITMSPFHMAHLLGHMNIFSLQWTLFYMVYLFRAIESQVSWRTIGLPCLFLVLVTLVSYQHALYMVLFTWLVVIWAMGQRIVQRQHLRHIIQPMWVAGLVGLGFTVILSPLLLITIQEARQQPSLNRPLEESINNSADLMFFILPSELHPLWGDWATTVANTISLTLFPGLILERVVFVGFVPLLLVLTALIAHRQKTWVWFWVLAGAFFGLLTIGPYLHIYGWRVSVNDTPLPMPYLWLYDRIPFMSLTRSVSRYVLVVMIAVGMLAAIGITRLPRHVTIVALGLICFEFWVAPYPVAPVEIPPFYTDLAQQPDSFNIAVLPMNWDRSDPLLHQTVHRKPLLTAYTSRLQYTELAWRMPIFHQWRFLKPDVIDLDFAAVAPTIFADFNIRYVVLDYHLIPPGSNRDQIEYWVQAAFANAEPVYGDGRLVVFEAPPLETSQPYLSLGAGWPLFSTATDQGRTIPGQADLWLHHPQGRQLALELMVPIRSMAGSSTFALSLDQAQLVEWRIQPDTTIDTIATPPLDDEQISLRLEGGDLIATVPLPMLNADRARLTLHGDGILKRVGLIHLDR